MKPETSTATDRKFWSPEIGERYNKLLREYVKYKTISLQGQDDPNEIDKCVTFLEDFLTSKGLTVTKWSSGDLNPVIFASYTVDSALPTVLIYGHYDVFPAHHVNDDWQTNPFVLSEDDTDEDNILLVGRGVTDNKGQNLMYLLAVADAISRKELAFNVKFFIEGDEETGSNGISVLIQEHAAELACDYVIVSDGEMAGTTPVIERTLRGLYNLTVRVTTSNKDLHSGGFGGLALNSVVEASRLIASLFNEEGYVLVPGFYDGIDTSICSSEESRDNNHTLSGLTNWSEVLGNKHYKTFTNPVAAIGLMPTIEPTGITAGTPEKGYKHIIPGVTEFMLNCRFVGTQHPSKMADSIAVYLSEKKSRGVQLEFNSGAVTPPVTIYLTPEINDHVSTLLETVYGTKPLDAYVGGGIPVVSYFKQYITDQVLLIPLATTGSNMHAANENIPANHIVDGLEFCYQFVTTPIPVR